MFIVLLLFFSVFGLAEFLYKIKIPTYITRKVVHIGGGLVTALLPYFVKLDGVIILGVGFFLLLLLSKRKKILNSIHEVDHYSMGALLFAPSVIITALIFWPINTLVFQGAILVLGLADGLAGIIGKRYGRNTYRIIGMKTIEGSLTFFLVTLLVLSGVLHSNHALSFDKVLILLGGSFFLTVVEAIFDKGWDNLFIPISAGTVLFFIL